MWTMCRTILITALLLESGAAWSQDSERRLQDVYTHYIMVKRCFDVRQGYARVYVTGRQMVQAREAVKQLEAEITQANKDHAAVWLQANKVADRYVPIDADIPKCETMYDEFAQSYPTTFSKLNREEKDF